MKQRHWYAGAGLSAVLMGMPVAALTQLPAAPSSELPSGPQSEAPQPSPTGPPAAGAAPEETSPFGAAAETFPTLAPTPSTTAREEASPFGPAPETFPTLAPPRPSATAAPDEEAPPLASPAGPITAAPSEEPTSPFGIPPSAGAAPPFITPPRQGFDLSARAVPPEPTAPILPPSPPTSVALQPLRPGAVPVQAGNLRAPPILIRPHVSLAEAYTDNPRNTASTLSDSLTRFGAGTVISVDSARLQGQLSGSVEYKKYARATDQDTLNAHLLAYGLGTVVRDHVFVDGRATITQFAKNGGLGFASTDQIPQAQQTQAMILSVTPIVRQSVSGYLDGELRLNLGVNRFSNGSLVGNASTTTPSPNSLRDSNSARSTLSLATGRYFTVSGSKLTLDMTQVASDSPAKSTQFRVFDDVEYQFSRKFAALARIGYEDLDYPLQPGASTTGPIWLLGGRYTPSPGNYAILHYGLQDGFYGFDGAFRYQATPATAVLASLARNLSSIQQELLNNLNASAVDAYGNVVNQVTGLPTALTNPQFALLNTISRQEQFRVGVQTHLGRDTYSVFAFLDHRSPVGTPIGGTGSTASGSDTGMGLNLNWNRSLSPRLSSGVGLGYASHVSSHQKTATADFGLTYIVNERLNAVLRYTLINVDGPTATASFTRNQVEIGLRRSF